MTNPTQIFCIQLLKILLKLYSTDLDPDHQGGTSALEVDLQVILAVSQPADLAVEAEENQQLHAADPDLMNRMEPRLPIELDAAYV
jgi:hypothetical protein